MSYPIFFDSKNSLNLFGLKKNFDFLRNLYLKKKLPRVLMLSGNKGTGKSTLINHFIYSIFDFEKYDLERFSLTENSSLYKQYKENIFSNIIYINGSDFKSVKVEDIRNLRTRIFQSTILDKDRFIILDDVEVFNHNSLNALLKIIEEPSKKNYFFLINNKSKMLLETIKSRSIELKIILSENQRLEIIDKLINHFKLELILDPKKSKLSPGNFIKFNHIFKENNISISNDLIENISLLLNLYKKEKDILFINLAVFISDYYFRHLKEKNILKNDKIYEIKNYIFNNLNNLKLYNINQNALIGNLRAKLNYE
jgi:DNA polymerase III subunit delta'